MGTRRRFLEWVPYQGFGTPSFLPALPSRQPDRPPLRGRGPASPPDALRWGGSFHQFGSPVCGCLGDRSASGRTTRRPQHGPHARIPIGVSRKSPLSRDPPGLVPNTASRSRSTGCIGPRGRHSGRMKSRNRADSPASRLLCNRGSRQNWLSDPRARGSDAGSLV
jgi:hypothetical protein